MKGFLSLGTLLFITFAIAVTALVISLYAAGVYNKVLAPSQPIITVAPKAISVSPTFLPTASPSATIAPVKKFVPFRQAAPVVTAVPTE
jgi:hypothetical protein